MLSHLQCRESFLVAFTVWCGIVAPDPYLSRRKGLLGMQEEVYLSVGGQSPVILKKSILEATRDPATDCSILLCSTLCEVMQIHSKIESGINIPLQSAE